MSTVHQMDRIEAKLNAVTLALTAAGIMSGTAAEAINGLAATNAVQELAAEELKTATTTTNQEQSTVLQGAVGVDVATAVDCKWDFTNLDKEELPADERIHGKIANPNGDGSKIFTLTNQGVWQKRRGLKPADKAPVMLELLALVREHFAGQTVERTDVTATTPPPPPPPPVTNAPPPPPPPPVAKDADIVFLEWVDSWLKETSVDVTCYMNYLYDTYGFTSLAQITEQDDRDAMVSDLESWSANLVAAQIEVDKIMAVYAGHEDTIIPALATYTGQNFKYKNGPSTCILTIEHDDIHSAAKVYADYYALIAAS